jgi:hypothetical protein
LLVSFPPLNYMLKFGGSSCLIGDPNGGGIANESFPSFFSLSSVTKRGEKVVFSPMFILFGMKQLLLFLLPAASFNVNEAFRHW